MNNCDRILVITLLVGGLTTPAATALSETSPQEQPLSEQTQPGDSPSLQTLLDTLLGQSEETELSEQGSEDQLSDDTAGSDKAATTQDGDQPRSARPYPAAKEGFTNEIETFSRLPGANSAQFDDLDPLFVNLLAQDPPPGLAAIVLAAIGTPTSPASTQNWQLNPSTRITPVNASLAQTAPLQEPPPPVTPVPSALILVSSGLAGLLALRKRANT